MINLWHELLKCLKQVRHLLECSTHFSLCTRQKLITNYNSRITIKNKGGRGELKNATGDTPRFDRTACFKRRDTQKNPSRITGRFATKTENSLLIGMDDDGNVSVTRESSLRLPGLSVDSFTAAITSGWLLRARKFHARRCGPATHAGCNFPTRSTRSTLAFFMTVDAPRARARPKAALPSSVACRTERTRFSERAREVTHDMCILHAHVTLAALRRTHSHTRQGRVGPKVQAAHLN